MHNHTAWGFYAVLSSVFSSLPKILSDSRWMNWAKSQTLQHQTVWSRKYSYSYIFKVFLSQPKQTFTFFPRVIRCSWCLTLVEADVCPTCFSVKSSPCKYTFLLRKICPPHRGAWKLKERHPTAQTFQIHQIKSSLRQSMPLSWGGIPTQICISIEPSSLTTWQSLVQKSVQMNPWEVVETFPRKTRKPADSVLFSQQKQILIGRDLHRLQS